MVEPGPEPAGDGDDAEPGANQRDRHPQAEAEDQQAAGVQPFELDGAKQQDDGRRGRDQPTRKADGEGGVGGSGSGRNGAERGLALLAHARSATGTLD